MNSESTPTSREAAALPIAMLLREGFRWFTDRLNDEAAGAGQQRISVTGALVMSLLEPGGISASEMARRMGVTRQNIHITVGELVDAGLLVIEPDPTSRRSKLIRTTPAGERRRQHALAHLADLEDELADRIGSPQLDQLRTLLNQAWGRPSS